MPSPFPGMNPYLENDYTWRDFHLSLMVAVAHALTAQVIGRYVVLTDRQYYTRDVTEEAARRLRADDADVPLTAPVGRPAAGIIEPVCVKLPLVEISYHGRVVVYDRDRRETITVIEILAPETKAPGPLREQYLAKRGATLYNRIHFVELDLLRGGPRMPAQSMPPCDYCVLVRRDEQNRQAGLWPVRLRERLPLIPIPLRQPDADAVLDLQVLLHQVYDSAGYEHWIYDHEPTPPLSAEDATWAQHYLPPRPA